MLQQLKSGFKRTINWNKYQSDPKKYARNQYLNNLVDPSFEGVNKLLVLSFENEDDKISHSNYYLPKVTIKDYNIMIDVKNFDKIRKIATGKWDDYTTDCLLDYTNFREKCKMIAIDLSKLQTLDADPKAIQQINFTANLERTENSSMFFIIEEAKETVLDFSQGTVKVF